jgi:hypothetical protein
LKEYGQVGSTEKHQAGNSAERVQHEATLVDGCRLLMTPWKDRDFPPLNFALPCVGLFFEI